MWVKFSVNPLISVELWWFTLTEDLAWNTLRSRLHFILPNIQVKKLNKEMHAVILQNFNKIILASDGHFSLYL